VRQFILSVDWKHKFSPETGFNARYIYFATPSSQARVISQQGQGALEAHGAIEDFSAQNEIFDDHFAFSGNEGFLQVQQSLPGGFRIRISQYAQNKIYTTP